MKKYYEAHITFHSDSEINYPTWKFSKIDGDPVLGKGIKMYLTKQFKNTVDLSYIIKEMNDIALFISSNKTTPVRLKIEEVVYDTKIIPEELLQEPL